jgi:hypothetical protein
MELDWMDKILEIQFQEKTCIFSITIEGPHSNYVVKTLGLHV